MKSVSFTPFNMKTYVALARGINVSGNRIVPMSELKKIFTVLSFDNVITYLNSGNVIFRSGSSKATQMEQDIERLIQEKFEFRVRVMILKIGEVRKILAANPFDEELLQPHEKIHITLLSEVPKDDFVIKLRSFSDETDECVVSGRAVYLLTRRGYARILYNNNFIEKTLRVDATTRNINTLKRIAEIGLRLD